MWYLASRDPKPLGEVIPDSIHPRNPGLSGLRGWIEQPPNSHTNGKSDEIPD